MCGACGVVVKSSGGGVVGGRSGVVGAQWVGDGIVVPGRCISSRSE